MRRWTTGTELVFIVADDDDWPKDLYGRLGFEPIGRAWVVHRARGRSTGLRRRRHG